MQENLLNKALKASREMIHSYFVERNVDSFVKYLDSEHFTFFFIIESYFYNSKEEFLRYAVNALEYMIRYELVDDSYSVECESQDSCLVVAKIELRNTHNQKTTLYKYIFYFKQQGDNVICIHNHVMILYNLNPLLHSEFFSDRRPDKKLFVEILPEYEDLAKVSSSLSLDIGIHFKHNVIVYPRSHKIKINDEIILLTKFESEILLVLADNINKPITADEIYKKVYENSSLNITNNALAVHISNIRQKLSSCKDSIKLVHVKDKGYCLQI